MPNIVPHSGSLKTGLSRRNFLNLLVCSGILSYSSKFALAAIDGIALKERSLSLFNPHTKEGFEGIYWCDGDYVSNALNNINHIMRDIRTNDVKPIDTHLLDLIFSISIKLKPEAPFRVISGYRSPKTNTLLRKRGNGAAKKSYHIKGQAVDIRLPGYRTSVLRRAAYELKKGGVGYYPKRRFVHIDVGPVRYWAEKN
jgi:uncharacterized protein YcbK (DUF882 family)